MSRQTAESVLQLIDQMPPTEQLAETIPQEDRAEPVFGFRQAHQIVMQWH